MTVDSHLKSEWEFARRNWRKGIQAVGTVLSKGAEAQREKGRGERVASSQRLCMDMRIVQKVKAEY